MRSPFTPSPARKGRQRRARASVQAAATGVMLAALVPVAGSAQTPPPASPMPPTAPNAVAPGPASTLMGPPAPGAQLPPPGMPLPASPKLADLLKGTAAQPLTIRDAVGIALVNSPLLASTTENLYRLQGVTAEARAQLNPTAGITAGDIFQTYSLQPAGNIVGTLPFDISGVLHAATSQAQFQEIAAKLDVNSARNRVVGDVKTAFYALLRAKAIVAVATENLQNSLDRLKDANVKYRARAVAYFDVVRAQTDVADARKLVIQARNAVSLRTADLSHAMGVDVSTSIEVSDTGAVEEPPGVSPPAPAPPANVDMPRPPALELSPAELTAPKPPDVIKDALQLGAEYRPLLQQALATRPEILSEDAYVAAAQKGLKLARRSLSPSLSLSAGLFSFRNSTGTTRVSEPQARLQLVFPLFDGGVAKARRQQAEGQISLAVTDKRQAIDRITLEVQQAYLTQLQARDEVEVANQALSEAQQGFELARRRYNAGVSARAGISPLLEVSDAQAALTQAETNRVDALYDYNLSRVFLDRALGKYAYAASGPGFTSVPPPPTADKAQQSPAPKK